jgi:CRP-like cAMP-binding protein
MVGWVRDTGTPSVQSAAGGRRPGQYVTARAAEVAMPDDTPAGLLTGAGPDGTSPQLRSAPTPEARGVEGRRRVRGARLRARHTALNPECTLALSGERGGALGSRTHPTEVQGARLMARAVPALQEFVDTVAWRRLVDGSPIIHTAAGELIYPFATKPAMLAIVRGVARVHIRGPGGGEPTTRDARAGDAIAVTAASNDASDSWIDAATDTTVVLLPRRQLRYLAAQNTRLAELIGPNLAAPLADLRLGAAMPERSSLTARIAGHLLEMTANPRDGSTPAGASVECLAAAAGVARVVASLVIRELRTARVLDPSARTLIVADRGRLQRIARGSERLA